MDERGTGNPRRCVLARARSPGASRCNGTSGSARRRCQGRCQIAGRYRCPHRPDPHARDPKVASNAAMPSLAARNRAQDSPGCSRPAWSPERVLRRGALSWFVSRTTDFTAGSTLWQEVAVESTTDFFDLVSSKPAGWFSTRSEKVRTRMPAMQTASRLWRRPHAGRRCHQGARQGRRRCGFAQRNRHNTLDDGGCVEQRCTSGRYPPASRGERGRQDDNGISALMLACSTDKSLRAIAAW